MRLIATNVTFLWLASFMRLTNCQKDSLRKIFHNAIVAADNGICSNIGNDVLKQGGNAVDAAIATAICIGVVDRHSSGLGGGHILTFYNKTTKLCTILDARETAPAKAINEMYLNSTSGWKAVAVPGEIHGFWTAFKQLGSGKVAWKSLWDPTIKLCREGFKVSRPLGIAIYEEFIQNKSKKVYSNNTMDTFKNDDGSFKKENDIIHFPKLADTMEKLANAEDPISWFYKGDMAKKMADEFERNGGIIDEEDFKKYSTKFDEKERPTIYTKFRNRLKGCGPPPPSSASLVTSTLSVFEEFDLNWTDLWWANSTAHAYHKIIEAMKFAIGTRTQFGDMDFEPSAQLFLAQNVNRKTYAKYTKDRIQENTVYKDLAFYGESTVKWDFGTAHISIVDAGGNAVSMTTTINTYFGAGVLSEITGIIYNDEMDDFSYKSRPNFFNFNPTSANKMVPGKRSLSSMSPIVIYNEDTGDVKLVIGASGGAKIIPAVVQTAARVLCFKQNIKEAIDAPRIHNQLDENGTFHEDDFAKDVIKLLSDTYGQNMNSSMPSFSGAVVGIHRMDNGSLEANCDFRKHGGFPSGY